MRCENDERGGFFVKKIFKEGDVLTESYINKLKNKFKEVAINTTEEQFLKF